MSEWDKMAYDLRRWGWMQTGDQWALPHSSLRPLPLRDAYSMGKFIAEERS